MLSRKARKLPITRPKGPRELRDIKKAMGIVKKVLVGMESPFGRTEKDVAKEIRRRIYAQGAKLSFRPIVAAGRNTCHVHHRPGERIIRRDRPLLIDLGAKYKGQCSDITRMYIPKEKKIQKIWKHVLGMQRAAIKKIKPGMEWRELNKFYKRMIERKGYKLKHSIGHGIGHSIHERIKELKAGMVITVEPGIYIRNFGGCRIEDMILIKGNGTETLSDSIPRDPRQLAPSVQAVKLKRPSTQKGCQSEDGGGTITGRHTEKAHLIDNL